MAISTTYNKRQENLAQNQPAIQSSKPYNGMQGVSQNTANNLGNYQQGYKPSEQVNQAQQNLANIQAQKPQTYNSKYGEQLDSLLQQIQNPKDFKYEFNGDEMFKYYADLYTQKGKQASMDAMGQAAALTGGYGNSYAQQAGQQAYQQYLLNLYDRGMDLRDRAYQQHQDQLANQQAAYGLMAQAEDTNYGRYRDTVGDWQNDLAYATDRADTERNFDYNQYQQDLNYWTGLAQNEAQAAETQRQFNESLSQSAQQFAQTNELNWAELQEKQREFDANLDENQRQYNQNQAVDWVTSILANGQIPSNELLVAAGLSYEDAMKLIAQLTGGGGGGTGNKKTGTDPSNVFYVDQDGNYYVYQDGKRVSIPSNLVKDNDLVHNEYTEGAKRRQTNNNTAGQNNTLSFSDYLKDTISKMEEENKKNKKNND